jgi:hypothetical protein
MIGFGMVMKNVVGCLLGFLALGFADNTTATTTTFSSTNGIGINFKDVSWIGVPRFAHVPPRTIPGAASTTEKRAASAVIDYLYISSRRPTIGMMIDFIIFQVAS